MDVIRVASFSDAMSGGNPAGIVLLDTLPPAAQMQACAQAVGYSETAFAAPENPERTRWRVRYFAPDSEVPFCGHATIALGAVLAQHVHPGVFHLRLNEAEITVEGSNDGAIFAAALQSPPTTHQMLTDEEVNATLTLFGYRHAQLDPGLPPARIHAGADHYLVQLTERSALSALTYDLETGRRFMNDRGLITITVAVSRSDGGLDVRNAFASGGVLEDPATGAAAAAYAGYLRDTGRTRSNTILITQGEDMGAKSMIRAEFEPIIGSSIRVSGTVRPLN